MYQFSAKSNIVLSVLALLALIAFLAVENGKVAVKQKWYREKLEASQLAKLAAEQLKEYRLEKGLFIDDVNDPNQTALIGQEYTSITTDRGYIEAKLSVTNPNYAAVIVQLLKEAGLKKNDYVAAAMTGSLPGLNIALLAAVETLKLNPLIITSVGSSNWGANDPYFTWLDMESELYRTKIFTTRSIAASIGGGQDRGRGLSPEGRQLILDAIQRNEVELIHEKYLQQSIEKRLTLFEKHSKGNPLKAYINIGGGIASLGNSINGKIIPTGLTTKLSMKNFPVRGVIIEMARKNIPIIHLLNIRGVSAKYGLPNNPVPLPEPGTGEIFLQEKYSMKVTLISTFLLAVAIVFVFIGDRKRHRLGNEKVLLPKREKNKLKSK